jgi:chitosanase
MNMNRIGRIGILFSWSAALAAAPLFAQDPGPQTGADFAGAVAGALSKKSRLVFEPSAAKPAAASPKTPADGLSSDQRRRLFALTAVFENGSDQPDYGAIEDLGDGRGLTAGIAGFCSGTGDLLDVVRDYTHRRPANPLAKYLPRLRELAAKSDPGVKGLDGFCELWKSLSQDPVQGPDFRAAQDAVLQKDYYVPALAKAGRLGIRSALGKAILYDSIIQHGGGSDPDGLQTMIDTTDRLMHGSPAEGRVSEPLWLATFLRIRRGILENAHDEATRKAWAESVSRVDALSNILQEGNLDLHGPIKLKSQDFNQVIP